MRVSVVQKGMPSLFTAPTHNMEFRDICTYCVATFVFRLSSWYWSTTAKKKAICYNVIEISETPHAKTKTKYTTFDKYTKNSNLVRTILPTRSINSYETKN